MCNNRGIISLTGLVLFLSACTHDPVTIDSLDPVCFDKDVMPIIQASCGISGCHDGTVEGFLATSYESVMEAVNPGNPRNSTLYKAITNINSENMMPPDRPLTKLQRSIIEVWIAQGAQRIPCSQDTTGNIDTNQICFVQDILPVIISNCSTTGCHDAATHSEGYTLTSYNTITSHGISPYHPANSEIYQVVTETGEDRMPPYPKSPLTSAQIADLRQWILDGAKNSDCPPASCDTAGTISFSTQVWPVISSNCKGCHSGTQPSGNINLSSYTNVAQVAQTLRNGIPLLSGTVHRSQGFVAMPPAFTLDGCSVSIIDKWISQGSSNN